MLRLIFAPLALALALIAMLPGCKQESSTTSTSDTPADTEQQMPEESGDDSNPALVQNMAWTFLTHKVLYNRATVVSGKVGENPKEGHWIDFQENGTFGYGVGDKKTDSGTWSYNNDTQLLEMTPKSGSPSEWKVMHKEDNIVLIGTARYGNNTNQEQWVRRDGPLGSDPTGDEE